MPPTRARSTAPGKIILFGEHAVVYGQPALAVPVTQVQAVATILPAPARRAPSAPLQGGFAQDGGDVSPEAKRSGEGELWIEALNVGRRYQLSHAALDDVLAAAVRLTCAHIGAPVPAGVVLSIDSTIPIASGLGSGAAVCTAIIRALAEYLGHPISNSQISNLVFQTEQILHGAPSGIDNTVIAYGQPVYFVKGQPPVPFTVAQPFRLLIGDTGLASLTKIAVGDVRAGWQKEPERYEKIFVAIGGIARQTRAIIEGPQTLESVLKRSPTASPRLAEGPVLSEAEGTRTLSELKDAFLETFRVLGDLMNRNHALLQQLDVSCPELDALVSAARDAGALGAKLSGGGRGGNMLALVTDDTEQAVRAALERAGAKGVIGTTVNA